MAAAYRTSHKYERKCADVVEASLLANRVGEVFDGVVIDAQKRKVVGADKVVTYKPATRGEVMLADPAVIARIDSADGTPLELGEPVKAKLVEVSVPEGLVKFEAVNA